MTEELKADQLRTKAARGALVTVGGQATRIVLQVVTVAVLARMLTPNDYGLVAMALVVIGIGEIFRDFGLSTAAIQAPSVSRCQRDNLFWANGVIGVVLALIVLLGSSTIAAVFGQPTLVPVLGFLAITFVINGFATQYRADLNRKMRFGVLSIGDLCAQFIAFGAALIAAISHMGYWALVIQQLTQSALVLLIAIGFSRWLPRLPRRGSNLAPFLRYGWHLMGTQIIGYASNNVDTLVIGLRMGPEQLGIYDRGFQLLMRPLGQLRAPTTTVSLPILSRLRDDPDRTGSYVTRAQIAMGYTLVAGVAIAGGAALPLVNLLLGPKWIGVAPIFTLLAVAGVCQTLAYVGYWVYLAHGLTKELRAYTLVSFVIKVVCIAVGSQWGVLGVASGYALAYAVEWPLSFWWLSRKTVIPTTRLLQGALRIATSALTCGAAAFVVAQQLRSAPPLIGSIGAVVGGLVAYVLLLATVPAVRRDVFGMRSILKSLVR